MKKFTFIFMFFVIVQESLALYIYGDRYVCPNQNSQYFTDSYGGASYHWRVNGGTFTDGTTLLSGINLSSVNVVWDDNTCNASVSVIIYTDNATHSASFTVVRTTFIGTKPTQINGPTLVYANSLVPITFSTPDFKIPCTGETYAGYSFVAKYATSYDWIIPAGWKIGDKTSNGTNPINASKSISVIPDNCTGGQIKVRALYSCGTPSNYSDPITVSRASLAPQAINGANFNLCGNTGALSYNVNELPGNVTYVWTLPTGWTGNSSTNNISVNPDGINAGTISVKALTCGLTSATTSKEVSVEVVDPSITNPISGPSTVCFPSGSTYTILSLAPNANVTWTSSSNILINTTTGYATANGSGEGWIEASISSPCTTVKVYRKNNIWVGKPYTPTDIEFDPHTICLNSWARAFAWSNNPVSKYDFQYVWRGGNHFYVDLDEWGSGVEFRTLSGSPYSTLVYVKCTNTCGSSLEYSKLLSVQDCSGGGLDRVGLDQSARIAFNVESEMSEFNNKSVIIFPNPASKEVTITYEENSIPLGSHILIYNAMGELVYQKSTSSSNNKIDISSWKSGLYMVNVNLNSKVLKASFIVK